jgi:molybdenum cofactor biosynthesis enzyme MoaA
MKLEDIGFYTLSDKRALEASDRTPLQRCELILTDLCNFRCSYCRGLREPLRGTLSRDSVQQTLDLWLGHGLRNIRFTGGEPTLHKDLIHFVRYVRRNGVERCALSTNGSAGWDEYQALIDAGANDFSVSLDGGCCATGEGMAGVTGSFDRVTSNIQQISEQTYCTVGMVFNEQNIEESIEAVRFAGSLGVADIRVIPSAQYNRALTLLAKLEDSFLVQYPILRYRIDRVKKGIHIRGLTEHDKSSKCWLALDDMAVAANHHFPCIIYLREGGKPIGKVNSKMRQERVQWIRRHNPHQDPICSKNCLDICRQYNNTADATHSFGPDGQLILQLTSL